MVSLALYDKIGTGYDTTRKADSYITSRLLFHIQPETGRRYLDLACGSGNYTIALKISGLDICGIDISDKMLRLAQQKDPSIGWILGDVEAMPFPDTSLTGAFCVLAIHHLINLQKVFNELFRVVTDRIVIFTSTAEQMEYYWLNEYFPEAMKKSIEQMPSNKTIEGALRKAGFSQILWDPYEIKDNLQDFILYIGKHRPEMYLDPKTRQGSSTFSSLADPEEVKRGCDLLKADIRSGRIIKITEAYHTNIGDYVFVIASK
jgi:SAM-dependent methyltransferase